MEEGHIIDPPRHRPKIPLPSPSREKRVLSPRSGIIVLFAVPGAVDITKDVVFHVCRFATKTCTTVALLVTPFLE